MKDIPDVSFEWLKKPPEWLKNRVYLTLEKFPEVKKKVIDQLEKNEISLNFAVFGYAGTGKTTLLNRMQFGIPTEPEPTIRVRLLNDLEVKVVGLGKKKIRAVDPPGRPQEAGATSANENKWPDWEKVFSEMTPRGIIFIVDHLDKEKNKAALRFVIDMIEQAYESKPKRLITKFFRYIFRSERRKARENLKVFLLVVNKLDIWETNMLMEDILENYNEEIEDLKSIMKRNEGKFYMEKISAKMGTNFEITFQNFIMGLLAV